MGTLSTIQAAFEHGGTWMYVILTVQVVALSIIVERFVTLYVKKKTDQKALSAVFEKDIRRGDLEAVIETAGTTVGVTLIKITLEVSVEGLLHKALEVTIQEITSLFASVFVKKEEPLLPLFIPFTCH